MTCFSVSPTGSGFLLTRSTAGKPSKSENKWSIWNDMKVSHAEVIVTNSLSIHFIDFCIHHRSVNLHWSWSCFQQLLFCNNDPSLCWRIQTLGAKYKTCIILRGILFQEKASICLKTDVERGVLVCLSRGCQPGTILQLVLFRLFPYLSLKINGSFS